MISLQSSAQAEALQPDSCIQDQGTRKKGEERKEREKGREVNKVSSSLPVGALWPGVCVRRRPGTKGSPVAASGSGPLAGKLAPEYPEWSGCQSQRRGVSRTTGQSALTGKEQRLY